jgi:vitamin B12 transporter
LNRGGWQPTARVGAVILVTNGAELRLAAYRGWRMPTLNELFRPFRAGADATAANAELKPETLAGVETGFNYRKNGVDLSFTAFANRLSDAIANVTLGHGPGQFPGVGFVSGDYRQRQNLDSIRVNGIEASAAYRRGPWTLFGGASYTRARVRAQGPAAALDGLRPAQTPNLILHGGIGWEERRRQAQLEVHHAGAQFEDDLNRQKLKSGTIFDAFLAWPLVKDVQLFARAENLFDRTVIAGISEDGAVERATPRTIRLGLRLRVD